MICRRNQLSELITDQWQLPQSIQSLAPNGISRVYLDYQLRQKDNAFLSHPQNEPRYKALAKELKAMVPKDPAPGAVPDVDWTKIIPLRLPGPTEGQRKLEVSFHMQGNPKEFPPLEDVATELDSRLRRNGVALVVADTIAHLAFYVHSCRSEYRVEWEHGIAPVIKELFKKGGST